MKIINITKILVLNSMLYTASLKAASSLPIYQYELQRDIFEYSITPQGVKDTSILKLAPKPDIVINGEKKKAGIIVDISTNILY